MAESRCRRRGRSRRDAPARIASTTGEQRLTQEDWDGFYTEARYGGSNAKKRPASKQDVIDAIWATTPRSPRPRGKPSREKAIERAQDAQLAAIQRGGCATVDKDKSGWPGRR